MPIQRFVHPGLAPVISLERALTVFQRTAARPARSETLVIFLEEGGFGHTVVTVSGTTESDQVIDVAETMIQAAICQVDTSGVVIASVRPNGEVLADDDDLWFDLDDMFSDAGLVLMDWLVLGRFGPQSPRELLGLASRWPT